MLYAFPVSADYRGMPMTDETQPVTQGWPRDRRTTIRDLQVATDRGDRWAMLGCARRCVSLRRQELSGCQI